ncbi:MAG: response regulator [Desulfobacterota bacterium]|nr:response regulator [Thermodesulfobacteriota bacterium]
MKRALIVDNDPLIVELIGSILEEQGISVTRAYGGLDALALLKKETFDIVFLDLVMPRVGGDRICKFIKQSPQHTGTLVVIVSAVALEAKTKIAELHPDACIAKAAYPVLKDNILKTLNILRSGQHDGSMVCASDGVHSRQIVQELLFAQRHFEAILNSMREAVIELDNDNMITYVNPSAQALLGKKEWELIGRSFIDGFPDDKAQEVKAALREIAGGSKKTTDIVLQYTDREYTLSLTGVVRDGEMIGTTVVVNDLTEKRLLEQERALRERLIGVIEMAGAAAHELNQPLAVISGHAELLLREAERGEGDMVKRAAAILEQIERLGNLTRKFTSIVAYKTKAYGANIRIVDIDKAAQPDGIHTVKIKGLWE